MLPLSIVSMIALCRSRDIKGCALTGPAATMTTRSRPSRWRQVSTRTLFFGELAEHEVESQVGVDAGREVGVRLDEARQRCAQAVRRCPRGRQMR